MKKKRKKITYFSVLKNIIFKTIKFFCLFCLIGFTLLGIVGCIFFYKNKTEFEDIKTRMNLAISEMSNKDYSPIKTSTIFYDDNGQILSEYKNGNYTPITIEDMSPYLINGYVAVEDKNFWKHKGYDVKAIIRAGFSYIKNGGDITQGGSTITQQVVKNCLLSKEQTWQRKVCEILVAREFEKQYTKEEILEIYLNSNFYGNDMYGVEAASQYYFGHSAKDLTIAESAILIGISNAPSVYNPVSNTSACHDKMQEVLERMHYQEVITTDEYLTALTNVVNYGTYTQEEQGNKTNALSTYAMNSAIEILMKKSGFEFQYRFANENVQETYQSEYDKEYMHWYNEIINGGYTIQTSLNQELSNDMQKILRQELAPHRYAQDVEDNALQGSACLVDNKTGFVIALVGSIDGEGEYNRAFQTKRQAGSAIKPILVYAPAFSLNMITPDTKEIDEKIEGDYSPTNANGKYIGSTTIRYAVQQSINTIAYKTYKNIGNDKALSYLEQLQFQGLSWQDETNEAMPLGGFTKGTNVVEMTKAYSCIANYGIWNDNTCIKKIIKDGEIVYDYETDMLSKEIYTREGSLQTIDCLKSVVTNGTGKNAKLSLNIPQAGKTGTTNDSTDIWYCGITPSWSMSIWVGYDTPIEMIDMKSSQIPTNIWRVYMEKLYSTFNIEEIDWN